MTPDELRALADAPTEQVRFVGHADFMEINTVLAVLAPDLARLCAELGEALKEIARRDSRTRPADGTWEPTTADADMRTIAYNALAKLAELEAP